MKNTPKATNSSVTDKSAKLLPKFALFFFDRPRTTALIWLAITLFGVFSYTSFLKREGFPNIAIPVIIASGVYPEEAAAGIDRQVAAPLSDIALKQEGAKSVTSVSESNFFRVAVEYQEGIDAEAAKREFQRSIDSSDVIPESVQLQLAAPYFGVTGGSIEKIDATISVYDKDQSADLQKLTEKAQGLADYLNKQNKTQVERYSVQNPLQEVTNPATGQATSIQRTFDRFGQRENSETAFYESVIITVASVPDADVLKLDDEIRSHLAQSEREDIFSDVEAHVSASYAPSIREQLSELQRVLLEGLLAVLVVGSIIIAVRASLITVISMVTVIAITIGLLFLVGYTLNVITLFALILGLSLIVDDTIIMVEALDSARRRNTDRRKAVDQATRKIGRAMIAATFTAALSFVPLLFVGGVLGSFIRAIPVTIISALIISLIVALVFIPLFARYLLLGSKQMGEGNVKEIAAGIIDRIALGITRPMRWAQHSRPKEMAVGLTAVFIGLAFVFAGGFIFQKVPFNIFPPSKDTNQIGITFTFPSGTTITEAEDIAAEADTKIASILNDNFIEGSYYGTANNQSATMIVELKPYSERDIAGPQLTDKIDEEFQSFERAKTDAFTIDAGPPPTQFTVEINATNREDASALAEDIARFMETAELPRTSGEPAQFVDPIVSNLEVYRRSDNQSIVSVTAGFDGTDTTALVTSAQKVINDRYTEDRLASFDIQPEDVNFSLGQESENQESFRALLFAFPLVLVAIYILLAVQFRSLLQPLLIFLALPFSFFGIALGLYLTNNVFSFFAMLGFFALIGLSIKNTILLTDYANQARRAGMSPVDAAVNALRERFRPLVATSLTAVFSLIPLAITSPFWEGLAVVLIFGLLSSTLLVVTVFPYYYLGAEYLRMKVSRRQLLIWLSFNLLAIGSSWALSGAIFPVLGAVAGLNLALIISAVSARRKNTATA